MLRASSLQFKSRIMSVTCLLGRLGKVKTILEVMIISTKSFNTRKWQMNFVEYERFISGEITEGA